MDLFTCSIYCLLSEITLFFINKFTVNKLVVIKDYRVRSTALSCAIVRSAACLFLGSSFVLLYLYVMCNYQGEIFAINEAEFKISAATLLNFKKKKMESIFGPPVA